MILYHGSKYLVDKLLPPSDTGMIRPGEEDRTHHRDVIFLTTSLKMALSYAGPEGYVYVASCGNPREYNKHEENSRKKKRRKHRNKKWATKRNTHVRIASKDDVGIKSTYRILPRRRGEATKLTKLR